MLHLNHLKKSFGKNEILTDIEYTFEEGNIYPVLGGAGAGRTTLFECIAGDIAVDSGTVETKEKCTLFFAAKQSVLPMLITGYQFISMLCDMNKNSEKPEYYLDKVKLTGLIRDRHRLPVTLLTVMKKENCIALSAITVKINLRKISRNI